jgi:ubiquinone/menaquinone biosynthesis C-methylase UbiE
MLKRFCRKFNFCFSRSGEKDSYSAGIWAGKVRKRISALSDGFSGQILEVGCGEGLFLEELAKERGDLKIYGIDNSPQRIHEAEQKKLSRNLVNLTLSVEDACSLPFADGYFDTVVCINVLFNLPSADAVRRVLKEMSRVCKKSGKIYFDFRNAANPLLFFKYRLAPYYDRTVINLPLKTYYARQIAEMAGQMGLRIMKMMPVGWPFKFFAPVLIIEAEKC